MEEPSVLDYLKSKLKIRQRDQVILFPEEHMPEYGQNYIQPRSIFPWRSLLAVVLALVGQRSFEPPNRGWEVGICFYLMSAGMLIWSVKQKEWVIARTRKAELHQDPLNLNFIMLVLTCIFSLLAFVAFGGNLFNGLNLTLWIIAIVFLFRAFWLKESNNISFWKRCKRIINRVTWKRIFSRWNLMVLVAILLVLFFRIYNLTGVPAEPFSDHAEKILDVFDITQGQTHVFFPRNTGREALQMYLTVVVAWLFGTGLSFLSLKIGTVLCGLLTLPYIYSLGNEIGNRRVGLIALIFTGIAYWPNLISRMGLRFPLYPLFVAPILFYLLRGLRNSSRNDFILSGFFLGLGLHGYSPFRIMPLLVVFALILYIVHKQSSGNRKQVVIWLVLLAITSLVIFLPLLRYWMQNPDAFSYRAFSRIGNLEQPLQGDIWQILLSNTWNALRMVNWSDGEIWVNSIPYRPALDIVSASLFILGLILLFIRYYRERNWLDLFLILSIPFLMLPSILSLAYPAENPALNRAAGAYVPIFIIVSLALEGLLSGIRNVTGKFNGYYLAWGVAGLLFIISISQNFDLVFNQFDHQFRLGSWNSSEMGQVIQQFGKTYGSTDNAWIIPFPYWVDTRLPGIWAGIPNRDFAIGSDNLTDTEKIPGSKLFIYNISDTKTGLFLQTLFPQGTEKQYISKSSNHDFMIFFEPDIR